MRKNFTITEAGQRHFDGLVAFVRVAEAGSFRRAAETLGISPSALSQTIRNLEARVGAPLLARTTRRVGLTEAGERLLQGVRPALQAVDDALQAARALNATATGRLRLTMPTAVATLLIAPLVRQFCAAHPVLEVEVHADDTTTDIVADGFDAGIRLGESLAQDMVAVRLTPGFRFAVLGAPEYLARRGIPRQPRDLDRHDCIRLRHPNGGALRWEFIDRRRRYAIDVHGQLLVNQAGLALEAASIGAGLAYLAQPLAAAALADGRLETVLTRHMPSTDGLFLYYPSRAQRLPKLRAFIDYARGRFESMVAA